jgi:hypothetical protein
MRRQAEAANHIKELLSHRGFDIPRRKLTLPDDQEWIIFEREGKQIGVDTASGVWVRLSIHADWRCIAMPCTVSGALQAIDFLTKPLE